MPRAPQAFIETKPTSQSCWFGSRFINVSQLAKHCHIDRSYLSRVLSGARTPSIHYSRTVALALKMDINAFVEACEIATRNGNFTP